MPDSLPLLLTAAASIGVLHTLLGPDHYLPFVALARARSWSTTVTLRNTLLCGAGHVLSSLLLLAVVLPLGWALARVEGVDALRGQAAGLLLVLAGLLLLWQGSGKVGQTPGRGLWMLLTVFLVGPCEPLMPLLLAPAVTGRPLGSLLVLTVFAVATLLTMCVAVQLCLLGAERLRAPRLERYATPIAALVLVGCGVGLWLGL